jgi:hypothetical protein
MEDIVDLPLDGEVDVVDAGTDYFGYLKWSEPFGSKFCVRV